MFKRPHHQTIARILKDMNSDFLRDAKCYFGGGTAISLLLDEYRESVDIDFLCADQNGYRKLRESVFNKHLGDIFLKEVQILRDVRADRDGIRTILSVEGIPIKFEIVREARIGLSSMDVLGIPVPCLCRNDLYAEKLLANADRYADKSAMSRDVIDLMVMEDRWGPIPGDAWEKASSAYGDSVYTALEKAKDRLKGDPGYLDDCIEKMGIDEGVGSMLRRDLGVDLDPGDDFGL
ncbi:MAG: nucleotidyl transferase AbiEii/AbiGii toxin family protein [Burkholderiales bacterium]|nr:nucleotidyl transferase AbiEii/AbiGii toxin family protein [Burkholderiales bacterium]